MWDLFLVDVIMVSCELVQIYHKSYLWPNFINFFPKTTKNKKQFFSKWKNLKNQKNHTSKPEASSAAYSLLTHSLGASSGIRMSADQIELLIAFVEEHLGDVRRQAMAFAMLKTILGRKKSHKKLYGLMDRVIGTMVHCADDGARREISNVCCFLFFLSKRFFYVFWI